MYNSPMPCVYVLVSAAAPDVVRYVGITSYDSPDRRFAAHRAEARPGGTRSPLYDWMRDEEHVQVRVVKVTTTQDEAAQLEREMIAELRASGAKLLNVSSGGERGFTFAHSDAAKMKISVALKGKPKSDAFRANLTGRTLSPETRAKIAAANLGRRKPRRTSP